MFDLMVYFFWFVVLIIGTWASMSTMVLAINNSGNRTQDIIGVTILGFVGLGLAAGGFQITDGLTDLSSPVGMGVTTVGMAIVLGYFFGAVFLYWGWWFDREKSRVAGEVVLQEAREINASVAEAAYFPPDYQAGDNVNELV